MTRKHPASLTEPECFLPRKN